MAVVGLIVHQGRPEAAAAARDLSLWLDGQGHSARMPPEEAAAASCARLAVDPARFAEGLDAVVTLGGDGSILRAVELVGESGVPILGVNYGRMGYLTEVAPADAHSAIDRVLAGDHGIEERMLLTVKLTAGSAGADKAPQQFLALNEAVVERPRGLVRPAPGGLVRRRALHLVRGRRHHRVHPHRFDRLFAVGAGGP